MSKKDKKSFSSISFVREVQESEGIRANKKTHQRSYAEGVYYARLTLGLVFFSSVLTTAGVVSYLNMPNETYYTTDYSGEVRSLSPYQVLRR